jgi:hypothetical protein
LKKGSLFEKKYKTKKIIKQGFRSAFSGNGGSQKKEPFSRLFCGKETCYPTREWLVQMEYERESVV